MIIQFFMLGKADELINIFKKSAAPDKQRVVDILSRLDVTNSNKYKQELK
jgi:hypothetical protein